jgi:hypothetical protein
MTESERFDFADLAHDLELHPGSVVSAVAYVNGRLLSLRHNHDARP